MPDVAPHDMTADDVPFPLVASASTNYPTMFPFFAFDGLISAGHYWLNNGGATGWLKLDFGNGNQHKIEYYKLQMNTVPEADRAPKDWTLQGSNNDADWDVLDTVSYQTDWSSGEKRSFNCDVVTTEYRYFKIVVTANNGGGYVQIAEVELWTPWPTKLSGTVKEKGAAVVRTVRAYIRSTGVLYSSTTSLANGTFSLNAPDPTTEMFVVAFDNDVGDQYNALIFDRVKGVPI